MFTFEGIPFIIAGIISLILGIVLLLLHPKHSNADRGYRRVKVIFALTSFIDVIADISILTFIHHRVNYFPLDDCLIPILFFAQIALMTFAALSILHSKWAILRNLFLFLAPPIVLGLVYLTLYCISGSETFFSEDKYAYFANSNVAYFISMVVYIIVISSLPICIALIVSAVIEYNNKLNCYFSGKDVADGRKLCLIAYLIISFFAISSFDFFLVSEEANGVIMLLSTFVFALIVFFIFRIQPQYLAVAPIVQISENSYDFGSESDNHSLSIIVKSWEWRKDKPFLRKGLTIANVANQMKITPIQLSNYIKSDGLPNFNAWINNLRIEEAKRLLVSPEQLSISDIASRTGFTDLTDFGKAFKRTSGITPSTYREKTSPLD